MKQHTFHQSYRLESLGVSRVFELSNNLIFDGVTSWIRISFKNKINNLDVIAKLKKIDYKDSFNIDHSFFVKFKEQLIYNGEQFLLIDVNILFNIFKIQKCAITQTKRAYNKQLYVINQLFFPFLLNLIQRLLNFYCSNLYIDFEMLNINSYIIQMNLKDFEGLKKYKGVLPAFVLLNLIFILFGPFLLPFYTKVYMLLIITYGFFKSFHNSGTIILCISKAIKMLNKIKRQGQNKKDEDSKQLLETSVSKYLHAIVIACYNEDLDLLRGTLTILSQHKMAKKRYLVYLAMEAHEVGADKKAETLIQEFAHLFKQMGFTQHKLRPFEAKGKGSNVSWCVEHLQATFWKKSGLNPDNIFITNMDADSWIHEAYFTEIDIHLQKENEIYTYIFSPPQIFTRNHMQVPMVCRVCDQFLSHLQFGNLQSPFDVIIPVSNYTSSYKLIKSIGFWDTCADAIAEDWHFLLKALWKKGGNVKGIPIYVATNQVSLQTGQGYLNDIYGRYKQAKRHAYAATEIAYSLKMLFERKGNLKAFVSAYFTIESFLLVINLSWVMLYYSIRLNVCTELDQIDIFVSKLIPIMTINSFISYFAYFYYKRRATTELYNLKNQSGFFILEFPAMISIVLALFIVVIFTIASFEIFLDKSDQYHLTQKNLKKKLQNN